MNLFNILIHYKIFVKSRISRQIIAEVNTIVFKDVKLENTVVNPFFGLIYSNRMLYNLRNFYFGIIPYYNNINTRDYTRDKDTDGLSRALIKFFPSPGGNICTSTLGNSNIARKYFLDISMRPMSIKIFSQFFIDILLGKDFDNFMENEIKFKDLYKELKKIKNASLDYKTNKEMLNLLLLTIHSFILEVLDTENEYYEYLNLIMSNISHKEILQFNEYSVKNIQHISKTHTIEQIIYNLYNFEKDIYPYSNLNPPISAGIIPVYNKKDDKFDEKNTFSDCMDIALLHFCNCLFFNELTESFDLNHLCLEDNSPLLNFYNNFKRPFLITQEIRLQWMKVIQCLNDIKIKNIKNKTIGKIYYCKTERNELRSCIMNVVTVLTKLCMSNRNSIFKHYLSLFNKSIVDHEIINLFEIFINLLINRSIKITCIGDNIEYNDGLFNANILLCIYNSAKNNTTIINFSIQHQHAYITLLDRKLNNKRNNQKLNIGLKNSCKNTTLDYLIISHINDLTDKKDLIHNNTFLSSLYNKSCLLTNEQKEDHLIYLYNLLYESTNYENIVKTCKMIVKSVDLSNSFVRLTFVPFFLKIPELSTELIQVEDRINCWIALIIEYSLNPEKYGLINVWNKEIEKMNLKNTTINLSSLNRQNIIYALEILSKTNTGGLQISTYKSNYDWHKISEIISKFTNLKYLNISKNRLTNFDIKSIIKLIENSKNKVKILDMSSCGLNINDAKLIGNAIKNENNRLKILLLADNNLKCEGIKHIADSLKNINNKIKKLNISNNSVGVEGTRHFSLALKNENNKLLTLNLSKNEIGTEGAKVLAFGISNKKLQSLDISNNNIRNLGAKYILNSLKDECCKLKKLSLNSNDLNVCLIKDIIEVLSAGKTHLDLLSVLKNEFSEKDINRIVEETNDVLRLK